MALLGATPADHKATREAMRRIFADVRVLLPLSASAERFGAPANRETVVGALRSLSANADALSAHVRPDDPRFRHLGGALARDARDALWTYEKGQTQSSQFLVQQLTESCISCHARLPSGDSPLAEKFLAEKEMKQFTPAERAGLQVATRRFNDALDSYEQILGSAEYAPAELLDPITDYLILAVRVKQDPQRPLPTLEAFARRPDLWRYLRLDVEHWLASLRRLGPEVGTPPRLERARALLDEARAEIRFPADRRALVHYVVASSMLHRYIDAHAAAGGESVAEAYYLLGLVESRIGRNAWVSQAGVLLEESIRRAPKSPFAETAYAILEEETLFDYGGGNGEGLPPEVAANLASLRALLDE